MTPHTKDHIRIILTSLLAILNEGEVNPVLPAEPTTQEPPSKRTRRTKEQIAADEAAAKAAQAKPDDAIPEEAAKLAQASEPEKPALYPDKTDEQLYQERRDIFDPRDGSFHLVKEGHQTALKEILGRFAPNGNRDITREQHADAVAALTKLRDDMKAAKEAAAL